ncbi:hypothetical protein OnM2_073070, partial [Erysiphe neolycopersici]
MRIRVPENLSSTIPSPPSSYFSLSEAESSILLPSHMPADQINSETVDVDMESGAALDSSRNLSTAELSEIRRIIQSRNIQPPSQNITQDLPRARRDENLPKWNGRKEEFRFYMGRLRTRIETEMAPYMKQSTICLDMNDTLPEDEKFRVADWYDQSSSSGYFNCESLYKLFQEEIEDKHA